MPDDDVEIDENADSTWYWTWQSPGGAFHRSPHGYASKAAAKKAGRAWLKENVGAE